jgi:chromosome segregation ATPase
VSSDGGEVAIRFTSQQQEKLWGDIARTVAALGDLQGKGEEMAATTGKTSASLRRFAEAVKAAQSTPDSRLADEVGKLDAALKAALLTQEQFDAASKAANERYQAEINKSTIEAQELAKAQRSEEVNSHLRQQIALVRERGAELQRSRDAAEATAEEERRDLERVEAEWERYAATVKEAIRTPIQTYHAKLEKLSEAHLRGKLTLTVPVLRGLKPTPRRLRHRTKNLARKLRPLPRCAP